MATLVGTAAGKASIYHFQPLRWKVAREEMVGWHVLQPLSPQGWALALAAGRQGLAGA